MGGDVAGRRGRGVHRARSDGQLAASRGPPDLPPARLDEFAAVARSLKLAIPAVTTSRPRSVIDPERGDEYLRYGHRVIDAAAHLGATAVSFGLFGPMTAAQKEALWFWTAEGVRNPDDPTTRAKAAARIRELGEHAAGLGIDVALEMYEDTYLGTADSAVSFVKEVGLDNVGLNPDLGNLLRLHRPVEHWLSMVEKTVPYAKYWHVKNYLRIEDPAAEVIVSYPVPLAMGLINYRFAVRRAIECGFRGAFLVEHYGGDGLGVSAMNRDYLRTLLPR
jgi:sugar phosphate isomerase/epimerase